MKDWSLLTFNFNEYEIARTHYMSDKIEHIYVSDKEIELDGWKNKTFNMFQDDHWKNCLYVRYHPFEFTDKDYAIVIDGSLKITEGIEDLIETFKKSNCDIGLLLSHQIELSGRIARWYSTNRITENEWQILNRMLVSNGGLEYKGVIAGCFKIVKKTKRVLEYLDYVWNIVSSNPPIRLDEIPLTLALERFNDLKIMPLSQEIIQGDAFIYNYHKKIEAFKLKYDKTCFWLKNRPVDPVYIGKAYHRKFEYKSEAMCLTKYLNSNSLKEWIEHHLDLGFDHIHIFDNESEYNCQEICKEYGDKVSYELIQGSPRHYKIFDDYVNSDRCKSEWIMPIDDDEYLELNWDICSTVNDCIEWYRSKFQNDHMFAIRWKHLFPKKFHTECTGKILDYCTEEDPELATTFQPMGDRGVKTIVHRIGKIHYEEAEENPSGGHVPVHSLCNGARLFNGEIIKRCSCQKAFDEGIEPARLIHCRYKGYTWYKNKNKDIIDRNVTLDNTSGLNYTRNYRFNDILEKLT